MSRASFDIWQCGPDEWTWWILVEGCRVLGSETSWPSVVAAREGARLFAATVAEAAETLDPVDDPEPVYLRWQIQSSGVYTSSCWLGVVRAVRGDDAMWTVTVGDRGPIAYRANLSDAKADAERWLGRQWAKEHRETTGVEQ